MAAETSAFALRGRWVFPVVSPPIRNGCVTIYDGKIVDVGESPACSDVRDLGDVAVLPGLVNAHTHLEFSDLDHPLGREGDPLPSWLQQVVKLRRSQAEAGVDVDALRTKAVARGLSESLAAGVTTLGEIGSPGGWPESPFLDSPLQCVVFQELLGLDKERSDALPTIAEQHLASGTGARWIAGLSPHSSYTVRPDVVEHVCRLSRNRATPIAMHLAECPEEIQLLASGAGPLVSLLDALGAWDAQAIPRGTRPLDYLRVLAEAERSLVIHGNFLDKEERGFLASRGDRMSVVYCPRTHEYFHHAAYPLRESLDVGINVCLGTDSRGSSPDLNLWAEMQAVARRHPDVHPKEILRMATIRGARSLGLDDRSGSLQPGKPADLAVIRIARESTGDPESCLVEATTEVVQVYIAGRCVHQPDPEYY